MSKDNIIVNIGLGSLAMLLVCAVPIIVVLLPIAVGLWAVGLVVRGIIVMVDRD